jgi:DNA polymerase II small subunit/DNA polymerase delta subunit B
MNSFNQTNFNERDNNYNNQISLNKSEKFQDAVNNMRLMMWNRFLAGVASNPHMTKKEVCHHLGLKVGTINSIQQYYKLQSPFYFKKPKAHRKKKQESESDKSPDEQPNNSTSVVKSKAKNKKGLKGGGETYDFEETFNKTVESLKK